MYLTYISTIYIRVDLYHRVKYALGRYYYYCFLFLCLFLFLLLILRLKLRLTKFSIRPIGLRDVTYKVILLLSQKAKNRTGQTKRYAKQPERFTIRLLHFFWKCKLLDGN
uniref:Uncharacterized protein n=1 Tax=Cacopsylla melanoneura TaxID=428564 RepID=A0A8D8LJJ0_9HEMI